MAAPLVQRVTLDSAQAQRELAQLERQLLGLNQPINVPVDVQGEQGLRQVEDSLERIRREVDQTAGAAGAAEANFEDLAQTLGISEDRARQLTSEFTQARTRAAGVETAVRGVASALGLSEQDARELTRQLQRAETAAEGSSAAISSVGTRGTSAFTIFKGSIVGVVAALAAIQGASAFRLLGNFAADAIQQASSLQESLSKTNVVFEDFSGEIQEFAKTAPEALGLSTAAALEATSTFGNLFVALGLSREAAAEMSPGIIQLAADLASFNNIAVDEAVEKLRSGLVGEVEPLRTLGVSLNAATVEAKAMELGFVDANGAVTEAGKVQARYALILQMTTTAQGDYARTADGVANSQRTLQAEWQNAKIVLGNALLPAYQQLLGILPGLIAGVEDLAPAFAALGVAVAGAAEGSAGFIAGFLEAGRIIPTTISGLVSLGQAATDTFQAIGGMLSLDFGTMEEQVQQLTAELGGLVQSLQVSALGGGLIAQIQAGVDPAVALANVLTELTQLDLSNIEFGNVAEGFAAISGVDKAGLEDVIFSIQGLGESGVLADEDIRTLTTSLRELNLVPAPPARPGSRGGDLTQDRQITQAALERASALTAAAREEAAAAKAAGVGLLEEAEAFDVLDDFATRTGQTLLTLLQDTTKLPPALQLVAANVDATSIAFLESVSRADEFADMFREIPEALATARSAFQEESGKFETNVDDFIDNLIDSLDAEDRFQENLEKLRGVGADLLANLFDTEGIESAPLLDALLGDPGAIAAGEARLEQEAVDAATQALDAFLATIDGVDFSAIPVEPILVPLVPALDAFLASLDLVDFAALPVDAIRVPVDFVPGDTLTARAAERAAEGANVTVNQTFVTEPQPTTQTTRAAQEINSIITMRGPR